MSAEDRIGRIRERAHDRYAAAISCKQEAERLGLRDEALIHATYANAISDVLGDERDCLDCCVRPSGADR